MESKIMPSGELNLKIKAGSEPFGISQAQNFRAGIEAGISCLKRAYGLGRGTWRGSTRRASANAP